MPKANDDLHGQLVDELKLVRRTGIPKLRANLAKLPQLAAVAAELHGEGSAAEVELVLRDAWRQLGSGPHGTAVGVLFGLAQGHRGGRPAALREKAADRLGYASVETYRKEPETRALADFADQVTSLRAQKRVRPAVSDDRVARIVTEIETLSSLELAELARQLAHRLGPLPPLSAGTC